MTKEDIKKALECCTTMTRDGIGMCNECPYNKRDKDGYILCGNQNVHKDALELIIEQEKEIEKQNSRVKCLKTRLANKMVLLANVEDLYESETQKLKEEKQELATALKQAEDNYSRAFERLKAQQQEIERLKAENERLAKVVSEKLYDFIDNVKEIADAREAWEKQAKIDVLNDVREKYCTSGNTFAGWIAFIPADDIDKMIEELQK